MSVSLSSNYQNTWFNLNPFTGSVVFSNCTIWGRTYQGISKEGITSKEQYGFIRVSNSNDSNLKLINSIVGNSHSSGKAFTINGSPTIVAKYCLFSADYNQSGSATWDEVGTIHTAKARGDWYAGYDGFDALATADYVKITSLKGDCASFAKQSTSTINSAIQSANSGFYDWLNSIGAPVLEMSSSASKTIAMHCDGVQLSSTTATDFIFVVPAGSYSHIDIAVIDESGTSTVLSKNVAMVVERSASLGINSTLPENGVAGTIEMMTEIWFEDANEEKGREEITAVSFNVRAQRNEDDVTNAQKWTNRRAAVYAFINQNQYDVIGTQECEYRQKKNIMDNVSGYSVYGRGSEYGKDDGETEGALWWKEDHSQDSGKMFFARNEKNVCFDDAHKSFNGYGSGRANFDHIACNAYV